MSKVLTGLVALAASACLAIAVGSASAAQSLTDLGGWWRFNENTATTINDSSANDNDGTLSGGAWTAGKFGSGLDFAIPGYVQVPSEATLESQTITAEAWVKRSGSPGNFRYILAKGANANFAASYALYSGNGGGIGFYVASCSVYAVAYDGSGSLWDDTWHQVTGTYGGGYVRLYVDGTEVANTPSSLTIEYNLTACGGDTNDLSSGDFLGGTDPYGFPGAIDEPRVWTRTLSSSDIGDTTAPTVTVSSVNPIPIGQPSVSLSATAEDPYGVVGGEYSLDDGTTWTPMIQSDSSLSAAIPTGSLAAGVYDVLVRATDYADNTSTPTSTYIVVYDPSAGFVTGGGWINSPAGAYEADASLTGRANFGFVSKYKKGATVPDGSTEFQFKAGDLNFHSSAQQWLVVNKTGKNAQFKGTGTINGVGSYGFMIWATDGTPDTFRIKIWNGTAEDDVVYDNGVEQAIGGGSIVVHVK